MRNLEPSRRRWVRVRMALLALVVLLGAGAVLRRAWQIQVERGDIYRAEAETQQLRDVRLSPRRGTIYDRHGAELAVSVDVESIYANPRLMRHEHVDPVLTARRLAALLDVDAERIATRLASDRFFVWIERRVTPDEAAAVRALHIPGIEITHEARRFYPNGDLAAHVLGFANIDGVGIEGLELSLEDHLRGSTERVPAIRDRRGRVVFSETLLDHRGVQGEDVYLTLDLTIQHLAEREIALAVRTFEGSSGSIVVMDPSTGEVLALANYPTYDPNRPGDFPASHRRDRALTDRFEPGSTIKAFTIAAALAAGAIRPDEQIDILGGRLELTDHIIRDSHRVTDPMMTPSEILVVSSNVGAAQIGFRLGRAGLYRGLRRFGFGTATGLPLPGETGGILRHHRQWYESDHATIAFGQGFSATTVQVASAMGAIANGGRLMDPMLVRRVVDARGEVIEETLPRLRRQVIPRATARLVADMLTGVTGGDGTGLDAAIDGYLVAGKTGTAERADYVHGGYARDSYTASFVGFVPADAPRLVIAVVVDEPNPEISYYGGVVAGPAFRRVAEASLRHLGVPATHGGEVLSQIQRDMRQRHREERERVAAERRAAREARDAAPSEDAPSDEEAAEELAAARVPEEGETRVPDLAGAGARAAFVGLRQAGLVADVEGSGLCVAQAPAPGEIVALGSRVRVVLERPEWHELPVEEAPEPTEEASIRSERALASAARAAAPPTRRP